MSDTHGGRNVAAGAAVIISLAALLLLPAGFARAQAPDPSGLGLQGSPAPTSVKRVAWRSRAGSRASQSKTLKPGESVSTPPTDVSHWKLAWSSEFNGPAGSAPSALKWTYERGNRNGWGNRELEFYCPSGDDGAPCSTAQPSIFEDGHGHLVIRARRDAAGQWTSGRMKTNGLYTFAYGRVEARMKLPLGAGMWPAFWILGTVGGWPAEGEMDIMEHVPQLGPGTIQGSVHATDFHGGDSLHGKYTLPAGETVASGFHTYGVIWTPNQIQYYVDRPTNVYVTITRPTPTSSWPFDQGQKDPFGILLNLAVGGNWPGPPDAATPAVDTMLVDYVRVYQPPTAPNIPSR